MARKKSAPTPAVPFEWSSSWSAGEWDAPFQDVDGLTPADAYLGVRLGRLCAEALQGFYWFETPEQLAEALCFALPTIFDGEDDDEEDDLDDEEDDEEESDADDEEESDADDEEESDADDDDVIATTVADFAEDDLRRTTYEELVEALRAPAGERDERMVAALGSVCELVEGLAQSTIEWLGTFEELRTASDPVTRRLRRGFRERQAELAEEEGGQDPRTPDAPSDGPIADEELPALHEWLATQGLAEC